MSLAGFNLETATRRIEASWGFAVFILETMDEKFEPRILARAGSTRISLS